MKKIFFNQLFLFFLVGGFFFCFAFGARAEGKVDLKVAPLYYDLQINPGEEKSGEILIVNEGKEKLEMQKEFSDFFIDDQGKYIFTDDKEITNEELKPYLMKDWFSLSVDNFSLAAGQSQVLKYKISVPKEANLGGHYGAIFFKTQCQPKNDPAVVSRDVTSLCVSGRVGVLFLIQVGGEGTRSGEIRKVELPKISLKNQEELSVEIANTGNTHFRPEGSINIQSLRERTERKVEIRDKTVLPTRSLNITSEIKNSSILGVYIIKGMVRDGMGREANFSKTLWMINWWKISTLIIFIILVIIFIWKFRITRKKEEEGKRVEKTIKKIRYL